MAAAAARFSWVLKMLMPSVCPLLALWCWVQASAVDDSGAMGVSARSGYMFVLLDAP